MIVGDEYGDGVGQHIQDVYQQDVEILQVLRVMNDGGERQARGAEQGRYVCLCERYAILGGGSSIAAE